MNLAATRPKGSRFKVRKVKKVNPPNARVPFTATYEVFIDAGKGAANARLLAVALDRLLGAMQGEPERAAGDNLTLATAKAPSPASRRRQ
jgi:hypothetical protein